MTARYLYAIGDCDQLVEVDALPGIDDAPVQPVAVGRLCALTSQVSVSALRAAEQLTEVTDDSWLAGAVRAHERVVVHASGQASVLPMRFGTVFAQAGAVRTVLREHQQSLLAELRRLAGATEWCLTARVIAPDPAPVMSTSGTDFLRSRQAALRGREAASDRLRQLPDVLRPTVRELVVVPRAGALRLWLLVDDPHHLHAALDELRTDDLSVELTGPWPAYHFVRTELSQGNNRAELSQGNNRAGVSR